MKKIVKEIVKKEHKEIYVSFDGKEWETEAACEKYESTEENYYRKNFYKHVKKVNSEYYTIFNEYAGSEDYDIATLDVSDRNALEDINKFILFKYPKGKLVDEKYIGKTVAISLGYQEDSVGTWIWGTADEIIKMFANNIREQFEKDDRKEN